MAGFGFGLSGRWGGVVVAPVLVLGAVAGCNTTHEVVIKQDKPMDININLTGRLDLVIHDARQDLEDITGEKPARVVNPEDIGLPALPRQRTGLGAEAYGERPVAYLAAFGAGEMRPVASEADIKANLAARDKEVRALWDAGAVGEAHTGLLVARGALTAEQQKLVAAENADRAALYAIQAAEKKSTVDEVALAYYLGRLGYAKAGNWYEKFNKQTNQWEWAKWGT